MEATGLDFISDFIWPLNVTDRQSKHECGRKAERKKKTEKKKTDCIHSSRAKNYDVSSSVNRGGFRDELSC